jgi:nicotinate-nucleotide pyrophosphorylase (carboxylating)
VINRTERKKIKEMLAEDLGRGDVTSEALVPPDVRVKAEIVAKQAGTLAGVNEASAVFREVKVRPRALKSDGSPVRPGDVVMRLDGPARGVLSAERVALNLLMRMSGIATATYEMLKRARKKNPKVVVAATRKTAPLLTLFDKRAVQVAGGEPHRYRLDDFILIKDNHLKLVGSVAGAVRQARSGKRSKKVEVEVNNPKDAREAAEAGANIVMLDNMRPADVKRAVKALEETGLRDKVVVEVSGGIDPSNIGQYAAAGADVVSSSYMTVRAPALDMSLEIKKRI